MLRLKISILISRDDGHDFSSFGFDAIFAFDGQSKRLKAESHSCQDCRTKNVSCVRNWLLKSIATLG